MKQHKHHPLRNAELPKLSADLYSTCFAPSNQIDVGFAAKLSDVSTTFNLCLTVVSLQKRETRFFLNNLGIIFLVTYLSQEFPYKVGPEPSYN